MKSCPWGPGTVISSRASQFRGGWPVSVRASGVPELRQHSYNTIGARLGVRSTNDQFGIALWGKNLTDEYYFTSRVAVTSFGFNYNHVGAPRTYGVTIDAKF